MKLKDWTPRQWAWFAFCALLMSATSYYIAQVFTFSASEGPFSEHALFVQTGAPILLSYLVARQSPRHTFLAALSVWGVGVFAFYLCLYQAMLKFWADVQARGGLYTIVGMGDPNLLARGPFDPDLFLWTGVAGGYFLGLSALGWLLARCEFWAMKRFWPQARS